MIFSGLPFLFYFLPATVIIYYLVPKKLKNTVLCLSGLVFYAWGEKKLVFLFAFSIFMGWILGLLIERFQKSVWSKVFFIFSVIFFLGLLGYFKYTDFFISTLNALTGLSIPLLRITLPIGISFYSFQLLSYTADVKRGDAKANRNLIDFAAYIAFFPQLIAGPIVRYSDISSALRKRNHSVSLFAEGMRRFILGLGKKVLLANVFGEVCADFQSSPEPSVLFAWMNAVSFMLQIYFDFSAYSDMAIGLGKIFGFSLPENFNYPYISKSITEFWRRWHMTLGSWFRDYVYIPLGGNRRGKARQIFNIAVVWMLTGFWHGASWNFVLWGLFYAVLLTIEKLRLKKFLDAHPVFAHIYVLLAVLFGFVLFEATDLSRLVGNFSTLFAFTSKPLASADALYDLRSYAIPFVLGVLGSTPIPKRIYQSIQKTRAGEKISLVLEPVALLLLLVVVTAYLVDGSFNPFLYFRF